MSNTAAAALKTEVHCCRRCTCTSCAALRHVLTMIADSSPPKQGSQAQSATKLHKVAALECS